MMRSQLPVQGAGLGLRRELMADLSAYTGLDAHVSFMEIAPENWIGIGGYWQQQFEIYTQRFPFVAHGLSLSLGSPAPLDESFVLDVKKFLKKYNITCYSEHLSYCSDHGHLYDLMPIPFTEDAVKYVANRIQRVQDLLGFRIAIENVSYYAAPLQEMSELEFLTEVLKAADCDLLLDVNNVYVNSVNHGYDARAFIEAMPAERIAYLHVAGHYQEAPDLIIDTHGAEVIDPVWALLDHTYQTLGALPTLLERDFDMPPLPELIAEVDHIRALQQCLVKQEVVLA